MRFSHSFLLLLLAGTMSASIACAQSTANLVAPPESNGCPVAFSVERRGSFGLRSADSRDAMPGQGLDLNFRAQPHELVEADITVHGMTPSLHMIPVVNREAATETETFTLKGTAAQPITLSSIWMKRLGTISWVELTRLVFSDGTAWAAGRDARCSAAPNLLVLVNAGK